MSRDAAVDETERADGDVTPETLRVRVEVLEEENRRLRAEYARSRQSQYRRTGGTLVGIALLALVAGVVYPTAQTVLFALAGTGAFLGVLVFYLTPAAVLPASVGERVFDSLERNETALVGELGLSDRRVYVPSGAGMRLYVPQSASDPLPDRSDLGETLVVGDTARGLALDPTGASLFDELEPAIEWDPDADPNTLAGALADALVESLELAEGVETDLEPDTDQTAGHLTASVEGAVYGSVDRFDHPVTSVLAVGLARAYDVPVEVTIEEQEERPLVVCRWERD